MHLKFKKIALAVSILVAVSSLTACGKTQNNNVQNTQNAQNTPKVQATAQATNTPAAPITILTGNWTGTDYRNESTQLIEKKTNTKINVVSASWGDAYQNKLNVLIASGENPDIMVLVNNADEMKFAKNGALVPINKQWDKYPNIKKARQESLWNIMKHEDGNVYLIPTVNDVNGMAIGNTRMLMYRKDWLDKLGLGIPKTLDDYLKVADAVSNKDPDGNGKKDTFAIGAQASALEHTFDHIFGAYGILPNQWQEKDGKVMNGSVAPQAKEALKVINKMFKGGMIDPEFVTDNQQRFLDKYKKGVYGALVSFGHICDENNYDNLYKPFKDNNPNGQFVPGNELSVSGYKGVGVRSVSVRGWMRTGVLSSSKNIDAAFRVLDFVSSSEGTMLYNYGTEGKNYTMSNGVVKVTATQDDMKVAGINLYHIPIVRTSTFLHASKFYQDALVRWGKNHDINATDSLMIPEVAEFDSTLNDYTREQYYKMILGEQSVDEAFSKFTDEWYKRGGKKLEDALNTAYKARKK